MAKKWPIIVSATVGAICVLIGIFSPMLMESVIKSQAKKQAILADDNTALWAHVPGQSGVDIFRNMSFYTIQNFKDVIFKKQVPQVEQSSSTWNYYEKQDMTNITFSENKEVVDFYFYEHFDYVEGTNGQDKIQSYNMGPLGAWYQAKHADKGQLALSGLSQLFSALDDQLFPQMMGQGLSGGAKSAKKALKKLKVLTDNQIESLATDPTYNLADPLTTGVWASICYTADLPKKEISQYAFPLPQEKQGTYIMLQNYFDLNDMQMEKIMQMLWKGYHSKVFVSVSMSLVFSQTIKNFYCGSKYGDYGECNNQLLSAVQWTFSGLTNYVPTLSPSPATPSISYSNSTVFGFAEIGYYYTQGFSKKDPNNKYYVEGGEEDQFKNIFDKPSKQIAEWAQRAMKKLPGKEFIKEQSALLNIGNLRRIFAQGEIFDKQNCTTQNYQDNSEFKTLQNLLFLQDSAPAAYIFWNYLKYFIDEFVSQNSLNPKIGKENNENQFKGTGPLGLFATAGFYKTFYKMQDFLLPTIKATLLQDKFKDKPCHEFFNGYQYTEEQINKLCPSYFKTQDALTVQNFRGLLDLCGKQNLQELNNYFKITSSDQDQLTDFCTSDTSNFSTALKAIVQEINTQFKCSDNGLDDCTNYYIAAVQWASSFITKNPSESMKKLAIFKEATTINEWYPQEFPSPFENGWFAPQYYAEFTTVLDPAIAEAHAPVVVPDYAQAKALLNFDKLFSPTVLTKAFLTANNKDLTTEFITDPKNIGWSNVGQFIAYYQYLTHNLGMGGLLIERSVDDFLFGFEDPFVLALKNQNPQDGGDPSLNPVNPLNSLNQTQAPDPQDPSSIQFKQSFKTGVNNITGLRQYYKLSDSEYIKVAQEFFDGNQTYWDTFNPYKWDVEIVGTDGVQQNPIPNKQDKIYAYITDVYNGKPLDYQRSEDYFGLTAYRHVQAENALWNAKNNPDNEAFYANGYNGMFNMSSVKGAPIFSCNTHFFECDGELYSKDTIEITHNGESVRPSRDVQTYVTVEPYSGVTLDSILELQINVQIEPDLLFPIKKDLYLPIYSMRRGGYWGKESFDKQFGDLVIGLKAKLGFQIGGYVLGALLCGLGLVLFLRYRKQQCGKASSLKYELTNNDQQYDQEKQINKDDLQTTLISGQDTNYQTAISTKD